MSSQQSRAQGIDVSHYQGAVNWQGVKQAGVSFAFAKASDGGTGVDSQFKTNWQGMKTAGIIRGAYHFFEPTQDATAQANDFLRTVESLQPGDLPPVIDVEISNGVSNSQMIGGVTTWLTIVQQGLGRAPMIYTMASFWNAHLDNQFGDYPLWVAHYDVQSPTIPQGWSNWEFWQHSQSGSISGVTGSVDLDYFNGSLADLMTFLQVPFVPAITPAPSAPSPQPQATSARTYTVKPGDTVDKIAAQFGVSPSALEQANDIQNPNLIEVGQTLTIP